MNEALIGNGRVSRWALALAGAGALLSCASAGVAAVWVDITPPGLNVAPMRIGFDPEMDRQRFYVSPGGITVIPGGVVGGGETPSRAASGSGPMKGFWPSVGPEAPAGVVPVKRSNDLDVSSTRTSGVRMPGPLSGGTAGS